MPDVQKLSNRRKHPRIPVDMSARIKIRGKNVYPLQCFDISMGGMRMQVGSELDQSIQNAKGKIWLSQRFQEEEIAFEAQFKVLWVESLPAGSSELCMGIEFAKMKRKHQDSLLHLLRVQGSIDS